MPISDPFKMQFQMSLLLCPLCGKNSSLRLLDPDSFDDDIYAQDVRGLGKGRGFETTGRVSIPRSAEVRDKIMPRLIELVKLLIDEDVISADEVRRSLGLPEVESVVEREEDESQALREETETRDELIDEIVTEIAEALGESADDFVPDGEDGDDEKIAMLRYFAARLTDDYMAAKADLENSSDV